MPDSGTMPVAERKIWETPILVVADAVDGAEAAPGSNPDGSLGLS